MDETIAIKMKKSVGGWPPRHARKEYSLPMAEAEELIAAGYAVVVESGGPKRSTAEEKSTLVERAKTLGIDVHARWGADRLKTEIAAAEAAPGSDAAEIDGADEEPSAETGAEA